MQTDAKYPPHEGDIARFALKCKLVRHFGNPRIGMVAGEKRIRVGNNAEGIARGEGLYWRIENSLKEKESELGSTVSAAGELIAIRKELFIPLPTTTILDDLTMTMNVAFAGYIVRVEPSAIAYELGNSDLHGEIERKIRIAAGGWQFIGAHLRTLLMVNRPLLWFQFMSHKVLRWSAAPIALFIALPINIALVLLGNTSYLYPLYLQLLFYGFVLYGAIAHSRTNVLPILTYPYLFVVVHACFIRGLLRYLQGSQPAAWKRVSRT
jgi:poly-beta-1,6-N-acetyl-D-glucosamine synthase